MKKISLFLVAVLALFLIPNSVEANTNCSLAPGFYTHPETNSVWRVNTRVEKSSCTKRAVKSAKVFFTYEDSWSAVKKVSASEVENIPNDSLGFIPLGPNYNPKGGALVKIPSDNRVYLILDGKKYWITKESVFNELNYKWSWIQDVDPNLLDKYETGGLIDYTDRHPVGSLVKYVGGNKVYKIDKNSEGSLIKRHIKNEEVFNRLGYRFDRVVSIDSSEQYENGTAITLENWSDIEGDNQVGYDDSKAKEADGLYPAKKNNMWGYVDENGDWKIEPQFNYAKPFFEGLAVVSKIPITSFNDSDSRWGVIDTNGEFVVEPKYKGFSTVPPIGNFSQGMAAVDNRASLGLSGTFSSDSNEEIFYLTKDGEEKFSGRFDKVGRFSDGLAPFLKDGKVGYINKNGEVVIDAQYSEGMLYSDGLIAVKNPNVTFGGWKYIDGEGNTVLAGPYDEAGSFSNGLAKVETENGDIKYINTNGETMIDNVASDFTSTPFKEGRAIVSRYTGSSYETSKAIMNTRGGIIFDMSKLDSQVCAAEPFHDGLAQVILSEDGYCVTSINRATSEDMMDVVTSHSTSTYAYIDREGNIAYRGGKDEESDKKFTMVSDSDRVDIENLWDKTNTAAKSENWEDYLSYYAEGDRSQLLNNYYLTLNLAVGLADSFSSDTTSTNKENEKFRGDWEQILKDFGLYQIATTEDLGNSDKIESEFDKMTLTTKTKFLSRISDLLKDLDENNHFEFKKIVDIKVEDGKGAVLTKDDDMDTKTREIKKVNGTWKWGVSGSSAIRF